MTSIKQLFGTVLIVSFFWLCFTLMIMTYHEELMRSDGNQGDNNIEEDKSVQEQRRDDSHQIVANDAIDNNDVRLQDRPEQDDKGMTNGAVRENFQQRVNAIHNREHENNKYDDSATNAKNEDIENEKKEEIKNENKLPDSDTKMEAKEQAADEVVNDDHVVPTAEIQNAGEEQPVDEVVKEHHDVPTVEATDDKNNLPSEKGVEPEGNNLVSAAGNDDVKADGGNQLENEKAKVDHDSPDLNSAKQKDDLNENKVNEGKPVEVEGNETAQVNQPVNPQDMAAMQKQWQEAMKQAMPGENGDMKMMMPNPEELQKAMAGENQPGIQVIPMGVVGGNQGAGNPVELMQQQLANMGANNGAVGTENGIPLGNINLNSAGGQGNPFANVLGGLGNPLLGNNGVVNPLAALLGAANNPAMQFNMEPEVDPPYKWEVDLDTIVKRAPRNSPGEMGEPVEIVRDNLSEEERAKYDEGEKQHAFNVYASDMISLRRRLKDPRDMACKAAQYQRQMPETSIIICFHNEAWSVLLRTVFSILDRSPPHLIKEIILVDDKSELVELGKPLDKYMAQLKKVKIVRTKKREGLIRARLLGVSVATGTVLTFMDSHCEVHPGWLEPLLDRIAEDPTRVVCPVINQLNHATLRQDITPAVDIGIFEIDRFQFGWTRMFQRELNRRVADTDPFRSPTMAGGLFSITKDYFLRMGKYDAGMDIWGGENLEMSFRIWMCGGSIEIHPCSHVGHIFRARSPYNWGGRTIGEILKKNAVRVAEVWADEYKHYYYFNLGYQLGEFGDVSQRKALRQKLHCTSFDTYVRNVYPELFPLPPKNPYAGEIRNEGQNLCIDSMGEKLRLLVAAPCHSRGGNQVSPDTLLYQFFGLQETGQIHRSGSCLTQKGEYVAFTACKGQTLWDYSQDRHIILRGTNDCLTLGKEKYVKIAPCANDTNQLWTMTKRDV